MLNCGPTINDAGKYENPAISKNVGWSFKATCFCCRDNVS